MLRSIIRNQIKLSEAFDALLPDKYTLDGNQDFIKNFVPKYLKNHYVIYDIGGGKNPYMRLKQKINLDAKIIGIDISQKELDEAPQGLYDETVCADITEYQGNQNADLVICQALLEHVKDTKKAFQGISSTLKPGGQALIFVPSRNAVFSRLNLLLPQEFKQKVLWTVYPNARKYQGFPSYYNKCTPRDFRMLAKEFDLSVKEEKHYFKSDYFSFFFPLYFLWRLWVLGFHFIRKEQAAETFSMALVKRPVG
jgi:SAM-dependent methyltransferase